jgi:hypothetical protein
MRDFLSIQSRVNEASLLRVAKPKLSFLFVEGATDKAFLGFHVSPECQIIAGTGKESVIAMVAEAERRNMPGILGLVDRDTEVVWGPERRSTNILTTDLWDTESMMLVSGAFDRIVAEQRALRSSDELRAILYDAAGPVAALRAISQKERLNLDFKEKMFVSDFVHPVTGAVSVRQCVEKIVARNGGCRLGLDDLVRCVETLLAKQPRVEGMHCGHDMTRVLAHLSETVFGRKLKDDMIEMLLRLAFDGDLLRATALYSDIQGWQIRTGFTVWKPRDS